MSKLTDLIVSRFALFQYIPHLICYFARLPSYPNLRMITMLLHDYCPRFPTLRYDCNGHKIRLGICQGIKGMKARFRFDHEPEGCYEPQSWDRNKYSFHTSLKKNILRLNHPELTGTIFGSLTGQLCSTFDSVYNILVCMCMTPQPQTKKPGPLFCILYHQISRSLRSLGPEDLRMLALGLGKSRYSDVLLKVDRSVPKEIKIQ